MIVVFIESLSRFRPKISSYDDHIHVFMLCRKFELIPIKIGFFTNF